MATGEPHGGCHFGGALRRFGGRVVQGSADAWCKAGYKDCDYNPKNGCETNVMGSDVKDCGDCGKSCETYPNVITKCNGGKCDYSCKPGWANCDGNWKNGCEKDVTKDLFNCGSCSNCCATYPNVITKCNGGKCDYSCKPGWANCDGDWKNGCEKDVTKDVFNCGSCGNSCSMVPYAITKCNGGKCDYSCKPGWANCDGNWKNGCEKDVGKDIYNCGGCGKTCPKPSYKFGEATCSNGVCGQQCKSGMKYDSYKKCCVPSY